MTSSCYRWINIFCDDIKPFMTEKLKHGNKSICLKIDDSTIGTADAVRNAFSDYWASIASSFRNNDALEEFEDVCLHYWSFVTCGFRSQSASNVEFFVANPNKLMNKQSELPVIWDTGTMMWHDCNSCSWLYSNFKHLRSWRQWSVHKLYGLVFLRCINSYTHHNSLYIYGTALWLVLIRFFIRIST